MPRKNKASLAALKGWRTRRANARARSEAAKKGWRTRRANKLKRKKQQIATPAPPQEEVIRLEYKNKRGKITQIEVVKRQGKIKEIRYNHRTFTRPRDIEALGPLLEASS